jgi:hypothetical protein
LANAIGCEFEARGLECMHTCDTRANYTFVVSGWTKNSE